MPGLKINLNKFKRIEITLSMFSNQERIQLEIKSKKYITTPPPTNEKNNHDLLNSFLDQRPQKAGEKKNFKLTDNINPVCQYLWYASKAVLREKLIIVNAYIITKIKKQSFYLRTEEN